MKNNFILFLILLFLSFPTYGNDKKWDVPNAPYRLEVSSSFATLGTYIPTQWIEFIDDLSKGITVYDETGLFHNSFLTKNGNIFIAPALTPQKTFYIYFGIKEKSKNSTWRPKIKQFYRLQIKTYSKWGSTQTKKALEQRLKQKYKTPKEYTEALKKEEKKNLKFLDRIRHKHSRPLGARSIRAIYIDNNIRLPRRYGSAVVFSGNLQINETANYQFSINSTGATALFIDNKLTLKWLHNHPKALKGDEKTASVKLTKGIHLLQLVNQRNYGKRYINLKFGKEGEELKTLTEQHFAPFWLGKIIQCCNKQKEQFPIIHIKPRCKMLTTNDFIIWNRYNVDFLNQPKYPISWNVNENVISTEPSIDLWKQNVSNKTFKLTVKRNPQLSIPIRKWDFGDTIPYVDLTLKLNVTSPKFLYNDEKLDLYATFSSTLPFPIDLTAKINEKSHPLRLPKYHYKLSTIPSQTYKIPLQGNVLKKNDTQTLALDVATITVDKQQIVLKTPLDLPSLQVTNEYIQTPNKKRVIIKLYRPKLSEIRKWSLAKSLLGSLRTIKKILVISDDFGNEKKRFFDTLKKHAQQKNINLVTLQWEPKKRNTIYKNLIKAARTITQTDADTVVVIPSLNDLKTGTSLRLQQRSLAALIEVAKNNKNIKSIILTSPLPTLQGKKSNIELSKKITHIATENGITFYNLHKDISPECSENAYYINGDQHTISYYPIQKTDSIATKLLKYITTHK